MFTPKLSFSRTPVYMLQLSGDFYDLEHVFGKKNQSHAGHCSALVKVTEGNRDLYVFNDKMNIFIINSAD